MEETRDFYRPLLGQGSTIHPQSMTAARPLPGFCSVTTLMPSRDEASWGQQCLHQAKGAWVASEQGVGCLRDCADLCLRCARCNWVSYSESRDECGWFESCDSNALEVRHGEDFFTAAVHREGSRDEAILSLPTLHHLSLGCSVTQVATEPSAACDAPAAHPCWVPTDAAFRLSGEVDAGSFAPDVLWPLQGEASATGELSGGDCASCSVPYRGRSFVYIGLCRRATIHVDGDSIRRVACHKTSTRPGSDEDISSGPWVLAAFAPGPFVSWQHQLFQALPALGALLPLLHARVARNVTLLHNGLLDDGNAIGTQIKTPPCLSPRQATWHTLRAGKAGGGRRELLLENFAAPIVLPESVGHEDSYPRYAFRWAVSGGGSQSSHPRWESTLDDGHFVAFLSRPGSRRWADEEAVLSTLRVALEPSRIPLVVAENEPLSFFRRAIGIIGVHGGALSNMVAMPRGGRVIEVVGRAGPRCFASSALGLGHGYHVYHPTAMPRPISDTRANDAAWSKATTVYRANGRWVRQNLSSRVVVEPDHFAAFVAEAWRLPRRRRGREGR